jgi:hypothetical protein
MIVKLKYKLFFTKDKYNIRLSLYFNKIKIGQEYYMLFYITSVEWNELN